MMCNPTQPFSSLQYEFGDIISYPRKCLGIKKSFYKHFAVYVGDEVFEGKKPEDDIFHRMYQQIPNRIAYIL